MSGYLGRKSSACQNYALAHITQFRCLAISMLYVVVYSCWGDFVSFRKIHSGIECVRYSRRKEMDTYRLKIFWTWCMSWATTRLFQQKLHMRLPCTVCSSSFMSFHTAMLKYSKLRQNIPKVAAPVAFGNVGTSALRRAYTIYIEICIGWAYKYSQNPHFETF